MNYVFILFFCLQKDDKHLSIMCKLLGIEESQMRMWLCHKKIVTVGEVLTKPLTLTQVNLILSQVHLTVSEVNQNISQVNLTVSQAKNLDLR